MAADYFQVKESAELGRFGVAAKDLKAGDVVFQEEPFAVGPKTDSTLVCLSCNCTLEFSDDQMLPKCSVCAWPLCAACNEKGSGLHFDNECKVITESNAKFQDILDPAEICHQLDCITPLR